MKYDNKKAFSLFELILVIFISSIVLIYTFTFQKELFETQIINEEIAISKIDLNSSKIIIQKNLENIEDKLSYKDSTLYFKNSILLKNVSSFSISRNLGMIIISISLKDKISQTWKFKL